MDIKNEKSLITLAEELVFDQKKPINIYTLFNEVSNFKGYNDLEKKSKISQFYIDLITSAKFVYVGGNEWDLKANQKIELWEKDGSYYNEYTEVEFIDDEDMDTKTPIVEASKTPVIEVAEEPVKEVVKEAIPIDIVEEDIKITESEPAAFDEEELFDEFEADFDEQKYNEYMDTYEDKYDK
ncbi:DNA-directed RNA polymerase subunit delta [Candidatus Izimaplasma bacterium ZiA1]|uniref:DNA-directed RNA polymerase subunit delta n=1 Tax=Candidatus Izimoplasma sp. ZiA1 TaxID=2024899 RepID=UPI000BAA8923|nr:DNA-directed RNA polymerase subunit delta [Candidatus Izimaplasma bacterium ZiA1]